MAQAILSCQLCENEVDIKWKCVNCDLLMCDNCKLKIHPKFKAAENHSIIDVKDIGTEINQTEDVIVVTKCDLHRGQELCLFCGSCNVLVCPKCIASAHHGHRLEEIHEAFQVLQDQIATLEHKACAIFMPMYEKDILSLSKINENCRRKYEESRHNVLQQNTDLINSIDSKTEVTLNELDQIWNNTKAMIEKELNERESKYSNMQRAIEQIIEIKNLKQIDPLIFSLEQLQKQLPKVEIQREPLHIHIPVFTPGKQLVHDIKTNFGDFKTEPVQDLQESVHFSLVQSFQTSLDAVRIIAHLSDNSFWIRGYEQLQFVKARMDENKVRVKKSIDKKVFDMVHFTQDKFLVSAHEESNVLILRYPSEFKPFHSFPGMIPKGLHATKDGTVLVGLREVGKSAFPITTESKRTIVVLDKTGKELETFDYDKRKNRLFTLPRRIKTNRNGDMCILDGVAPGQGRVIQMTNAEISWTFDGHESIGDSFNPWGIEITSRDNIVVSDWNSECLIVLNNVGQILKFQKTNEMGITIPFSLLITHPGQVWVGTNTLKFDKETHEMTPVQKAANLHLLEFKGF